MKIKISYDLDEIDERNDVLDALADAIKSRHKLRTPQKEGTRQCIYITTFKEAKQ